MIKKNKWCKLIFKIKILIYSLMGRQRFYTIYANDEDEFSKVTLNIFIINKKLGIW